MGRAVHAALYVLQCTVPGIDIFVFFSLFCTNFFFLKFLFSPPSPPIPSSNPASCLVQLVLLCSSLRLRASKISADPSPHHTDTLDTLTLQCFNMRALLSLVALATVSSSTTELTTYTEIITSIPVGNDGKFSAMPVFVPVLPGNQQIADPATLFNHVQGVWNAVIEDNQAGLVDAKAMMSQQPPLTKEEAWHHYRAGQQGVIDSARFLIAFSVVPSVQSGGSALHTAASHNRHEEIHTFLEDPLMDVDQVQSTGSSSSGWTALFNAVSLGHVEATKALLAHEANPNHAAENGVTCLHIAASFGHVKILEMLLDSGADMNVPHPFAQTTPLHFAAEMGRSDVIKLLCSRGANVHARKKMGGTALHTASDTNQTRSVASLLAAPCNASPNILLNGDTTPLYLASQRGFSQVAEVLVSQGADVNFVMPFGKFHGKLMATGKAGTNGEGQFYSTKNNEIGNGATALHAAVENGHLNMTRTLLKLGAKQLTSMQGASPLLIALQYKHPKIALLLLKGKNSMEKACVNSQAPQDGAFPLFVAAGAGYSKVVRRLIKIGANVHLKRNDGSTALAYARYRRQTKVVQMLLDAMGVEDK